FAFTLPALNRQEPDKRFEWTSLPQGARNSPTLCQLYVDNALQPLRKAWPEVIIYHYMDDILFAQSQPFTGQQIQEIHNVLKLHGLVVAPEKIQLSAPWKYLGWSLTDQVILQGALETPTEFTTLHDAQKLLGDLQWLRPVVSIPNELINELRPLLKGSDPMKPVHMTPEQVKILQQILDCVT
ncbi:POK7 protein, partial [Passerina amoena]|nr:POK7 protein [Passerina amoena]